MCISNFIKRRSRYRNECAYLFPFVSGKILARENATAPLRPEKRTICICAQVIASLDCKGLGFVLLSTDTFKLVSSISIFSVTFVPVSSLVFDCEDKS
jgi:hypothetical protein